LKMVSIANAKGGVGKTTTAVNMAAGLASMGKRVLVLDLDCQANTTWAFLGDESSRDISDVLLEGININDAIVPLSENLSIIPAHLRLSLADTALAAEPGRDTALAAAIEDLDRNRYDFIIADLPPNAGVMVLNGLAASDYVIIPIQMEFYSMKSVEIIIDLITLTKKRLNRRLVLLGALATMYDKRNNICVSCLDEMKKYFNSMAFETVIRSNVSLAEAPAINKNIFQHSPKSYGAEDYLAFCEEFLRREEAARNVVKGSDKSV
jgi:chromosome partitioning protein